MVSHIATRAPPRAQTGKPWLEVENQARAATATTRPHHEQGDSRMVMIRKNPSFGKPHWSSNPNCCPACGKQNCPCFAAGSSMTYNKVNRQLSENFGVPCPNTGSPRSDFEQLLGLIRRR